MYIHISSLIMSITITTDQCSYNKIIFVDDITKETLNTSTVICNMDIDNGSDFQSENTSI